MADTKLPKEIFAVEVTNHELLKLAYDSYLANARLSSATTKQRGEVSGGVRSHGSKKVLVEHVLARAVTQFGVVVA